MTGASFLHHSQDEQCAIVRQWCKQNGVCPPAEGWEWTWFDRLFMPAEVMRALPSFKLRLEQP